MRHVESLVEEPCFLAVLKNLRVVIEPMEFVGVVPAHCRLTRNLRMEMAHDELVVQHLAEHLGRKGERAPPHRVVVIVTMGSAVESARPSPCERGGVRIELVSTGPALGSATPACRSRICAGRTRESRRGACGGAAAPSEESGLQDLRGLRRSLAGPNVIATVSAASAGRGASVTVPRVPGPHAARVRTMDLILATFIVPSAYTIFVHVLPVVFSAFAEMRPRETDLSLRMDKTTLSTSRRV